MTLQVLLVIMSTMNKMFINISAYGRAILRHHVALLQMLCLGVLLTPYSQVHAALEIEINGGAAQQIPVAVLPLVEPANVPDKNRLHEIIANDLKSSGLFRVINVNGMPALPVTVAQVRYPEWAALKAQALSLGEVQPAGNGQLKVTVQVMDVLRQSALLQLNYTFPPSQYRHTAHLIADEIYEKFTGQPGVFASNIAFVTKVGKRFTLQVADADGMNPQTLLASNEPIISPAWSPDCSKMAYVSFEKKKPIVFVQSLYTGERHEASNFKGNNSAPAWSPDGQRLAVVLTYGANSQIYTMSPNGQDVQRITKSNSIDTEPVFSPDGQWIYFTSDRGGRPQIYKVSVNGGSPVRVTFEGGYNVSPRFSSDGQFLAYIRNEGGAFKVVTQNLATGEVKVLSDGPQDESPTFAPNGRLVMYATKTAGRGTIATVSVDGQTRQRFSDLGGEIREPAWCQAIKKK